MKDNVKTDVREDGVDHGEGVREDDGWGEYRQRHQRRQHWRQRTGSIMAKTLEKTTAKTTDGSKVCYSPVGPQLQSATLKSANYHCTLLRFTSALHHVHWWVEINAMVSIVNWSQVIAVWMLFVCRFRRSWTHTSQYRQKEVIWIKIKRYLFCFIFKSHYFLVFIIHSYTSSICHYMWHSILTSYPLHVTLLSTIICRHLYNLSSL